MSDVYWVWRSVARPFAASHRRRVLSMENVIYAISDEPMSAEEWKKQYVKPIFYSSGGST
jgi:hypothetical protein